jgi:hypothetical protein
MFSILIKLRRAIKRFLKVQSESRQAQQPTLRSRVNKGIMLVVAAFIVGVFYPGENLFDPLNMPREGEISLEDVLAPFQIVVYKTERELREERELIRAAVPFVLDADTVIVNQSLIDLRRYGLLIDSLRQAHDTLGAGTMGDLAQLVAGRFPMLSREAILQSLRRPDLNRAVSRLQQILQDEIYKVGVLPNEATIPETRSKSVLVRRGDRESIHSRDRVLPLAEANVQLLSALNEAYAADSSVDVEFNYLVGRTFIQPNLRLATNEYNRRVQEELEAISEIKEVVREGDIIARSGNRINERQERILREMSRLSRERAAREGGIQAWLPAAARVFFSFAAFGGLYFFLFYFRRELFHSNPKILALLLIFGLVLFLVWLAGEQLRLSMYLFPVAMLAMLVTVLFDAEVGIIATVVLALLLGIMHRFNFPLALVTMFVGTVACLTSRSVTKRSDFFKIMFLTALAYVVIIPIIEGLRLTPSTDIPTEMGYGVVSALVAVFLTIGVLPVFESLFGITTDIRLLELSDMNHPVLKRLALEAPGTYHHVINVGNLCEAAAKEIGANHLLARVGTYYHDIGKMEIPEYFVENQLSIKSKHDELTPSMSALILAAHVKKGRAIGEAADIPDDVLNFIEEHHGTMVMTYFYNKALEEGDEDVSPDKFRYPGPKPQIKETGICMLADGVEAASRTLDDPKPARIRTLIQRIIDDRVAAGELDECPLTLRDLARIREAFLKVLVGAFHHRVVYPTREQVKARS